MDYKLSNVTIVDNIKFVYRTITNNNIIDTEQYLYFPRYLNNYTDDFINSQNIESFVLRNTVQSLNNKTFNNLTMTYFKSVDNYK